tara:strand:- start:672 stop:773 length:102 start_codon:yes stop_codon:yes gene_type:complete
MIMNEWRKIRIRQKNDRIREERWKKEEKINGEQ